MSDPVYHFTDTARLPWIWASGELQPGRNQIGGYPVDFLWATTNRQGDRTASGMQAYRVGGTALVRLTLHAEDFEEWPGILRRFPQWTNTHVAKLEAVARNNGQTNLTCWRVRAEPLPIARVISVEAKPYTSNWRAINPAVDCIRNGDIWAVNLGGTLCASRQYIEPGKPAEYDTKKVLPYEWQYRRVSL